MGDAMTDTDRASLRAKALAAPPRLLDLFCGAGGAAVGYARAGFEVVGVDIRPQPHYPFEFHCMDAMYAMVRNLGPFEAFHASPPCQAFTRAQRIQGREHPDFIGAFRNLFTKRGLPWVIENVPGAPLINPTMLCGTMFGLKVERRRLFETSFPVPLILDHQRKEPQAKMGRAPRDGEFMHVVGNFSGVDRAREAMGIDWMTRDELREAIPPAYTEHIGRSLIAALERAA